MDKWIMLSNKSSGRDKIARLVQYISRTLWATLESADLTPGLSENLKNLEYILSTFRKLLRFGKCLEVFYDCLRLIHYPDLIVRVTLTISKLSQSLFLFADHFTWLASTDFFGSLNGRKCSFHANRYWLLSITMNLCRDLYEIMRLLSIYKPSISSDIEHTGHFGILSIQNISRYALHCLHLAWIHKEVAVDTIRNVCDIFIPLTALGHTNMKPKTIGLLGTISSLAALIALIDPSAKLEPI